MTKKQIIETGRAVLRLEGKAVSDLSQNLGDEFARAVGLLCRTKTRVIVLGMGKSGLVGRKLAATLASCGTPAIFIHPAEAAPGDLGMILQGGVAHGRRRGDAGDLRSAAHHALDPEEPAPRLALGVDDGEVPLAEALLRHRGDGQGVAQGERGRR